MPVGQQATTDKQTAPATHRPDHQQAIFPPNTMGGITYKCAWDSRTCLGCMASSPQPIADFGSLGSQEASSDDRMTAEAHFQNLTDHQPALAH